MIEDDIEKTLLPACGDIVIWKGSQYRVLGLSQDPNYWKGFKGENEDALKTTGAVLLCIDNAECTIFIPRAEARILKTDPRYVMMRLLSYLEKRGAIDWDQIDDHERVELDEV